MTTPTPSRSPILVAVDGSDQAALATRVAADLAGAWHAPLHVVHAWRPYLTPAVYAGMGSGVVLTRDTVEVLHEGAVAVMAGARAALTSQGVTATEHLVEAVDAPSAILDVARDVDAGLVVAGRRGLGPVRRIFLGSVSEALLHRSTAPLLLLQGDASCWPPRTVVAAIDGSDEATRAARLGADTAAATGAAVALVHAVPRNVDFVGIVDGIYGETMTDVAAQVQERADELARLSGARVDAQVELAAAAPAILAAVIAGPSPVLVAMGTHGHGAAYRFMLGSVAATVLHDDAVTSMLVVPPTTSRG